MPEKHDHHRVLLIALVIASVSLIAVLIFFAYQIFYGNRVLNVKRIDFDDSLLNESYEAQQERIENNLQETLSGLETIENETENSADNLIYPATSIKPSFIYPKTWYTYSSTLVTSAAGNLNTLIVDDKKIDIQEGTEAAYGDVIIYTWEVNPEYQNQFPTRTAYIIDSLRGANLADSSIESTPHQNATLTTISGKIVEGSNPGSVVDMVIYETATTAVQVIFTNQSTETKLIKSTLDFSSIQ